jgi:hypothetical protein
MQDKAPEKWSKGAIRAHLDERFPYLDDQDLYVLTSMIYVIYIDGRIEGMDSANKIWQEAQKPLREVSHV